MTSNLANRPTEEFYRICFLYKAGGHGVSFVLRRTQLPMSYENRTSLK